MSPIISIIIPIYNTQRYLNECIDSVLCQSYQNIEVILVDDGSPDNSAQICDEYAEKDHRIKVIHKENGGLSDARNAGIHVATGKYLMFLDSDDFWNDIVDLHKLVNKLEADTSLDFLLFGMIKYFPKKDRTSKQVDFPELALSETADKLDRLKALQEVGIFPMSAWSKLIKRSCLIDNSLFFRKGITAEDIVWFIELMEDVNNFTVVNDFFYMYRQEVDGSITRGSKTISNLKTIFFETVEKYKDINTEYSNIVLAYMAYEYLIILAFVKNFDRDTQIKFKSYSWILKFDTNIKVKFSNMVIRLFGFELTSLILRFYIKIVVKIK